MLNRFLASLVLSLFLLPVAQAQPTFRFRVFLPTDVDCTTELSKIAARFQQQTQLTVVGQSCTPVSVNANSDFKANAASLTYEAAAKVTGSPVVIGTGYFSPEQAVTSTTDLDGAYDSYASCRADVANQVSLFKANMKTEPVAAYCAPDSTIGTSYVLRIESFTSSSVRLYVFRAFQGQASDQDMKSVTDLVSKKGGAVIRVYENSIYFYDAIHSARDTSSRHVNLDSTYAVISTDSAQCQLQLTDIEQILNSMGKNSAIAACTNGEVGNSVEIVDKGVSSFNFDPEGVGIGYSSYEECTTDRARVVQNAQIKSKDVVGGICSLNGIDEAHQYDLILVTRW